MWLHETRGAFGDDKSLIELLLAVADGRYTFGEIEDACRRARRDGCVTRAAVEQRVLVSRTDRSDVLERLAPEECSGLDGHRFAIESPEMYDQILERARREAI